MSSFNLESVLIFSILLQFTIAISDCDTYMDCKTCTKERIWSVESCHWCPLDRACHFPFSPLNPCINNENIENPQKCVETNYGKYDRNYAFLHTLISAAAYSKDPKTCLQKMVATKNFEVMRIIKHRCEDLPLFHYKECLAFTAVSHKYRVIALAFRGTLTPGSQIIDQIISVLTTPKISFLTGGKVQRYFAHAHLKLYKGVNASVAALIKMNPSYNLMVTGHSLGGALASLAAVSLAFQRVLPLSRMSVYTFGQPRVGDKEFAFHYDRLVNNSWRVVHHRDIVSHLPTCTLIEGCSLPINGPYHHRTEIFYPNITMKMDSYYKECKGDDSFNCSDGIILKKPCISDVKDCIKDHINYFDLHVGELCDKI